MFVRCICCPSPVYDFIDKEEFKIWRKALNYFIINPFLLELGDEYQFVHDAYDRDGNIIGRFTAPSKLSRQDACNLLKNDKGRLSDIEWANRRWTEKEIEAELENNRHMIFKSLEDARPGGFPSRAEIENLLKFDGEKSLSAAWNEWRTCPDNWSGKISFLGGFYRYDPVMYCRSFKDIEWTEKMEEEERERERRPKGPTITDEDMVWMEI